MEKILFYSTSAGAILLPLFFFPKTGDILNLPKIFFLFFWVSLLVLFFSIAAIRAKKLVLKRSMLSLPLVAFGLSMILSAIFSVAPHASIFGNTESFTLTILSIFPAMIFCFLLIQMVRTQNFFSFLLQTFFFSSFCVQAIFFLIQIPVFQNLSLVQSLGENFFNTVSSANSVFGIWVAAIGVLSSGFVFLKGRKWFEYVLPVMVALLSFFTIFRLGFTISLWIYVIGLALLFIVPFLFIRLVHIKSVLAVFVLFLCSVSALLFGFPKFFTMNAPIEIALGSPASFDIVKQVLQSDIKHFLFGSGPGTFIYDFSLYRTSAFNTNAIVATTRFYSPFSSFFALMAETGLLGIISFILIILMGLGALISVWVEMRSSQKEIMQQKFSEWLHDSGSGSFSKMFDLFILGVAWLCLTFGIFVSFFDLTLWWTWWTVLGLVIAGISFVNKKFVVEREVSLQVSPQYSLALSFGILFFFTLVVLSSAFGVRMYLAEYFFSHAKEVSSLSEAEASLQRSIEYRPSYAPYHVALARIYLQQASTEFQKNKNNTQEVSALVVQGANQAKRASELDPKNVANWETLALMYLNAESFAPEALVWAKEALISAIALEPSNAVNHARLAQIFLAEKDFGSAEKEYLKTIELKFDYLPAYEALIQIYAGQEKYDLAISVYDSLLKIAPVTPDLIFHYGILFFNRNAEGDTKKAEALWLEVVNQNPQHQNALYSLGLVYERLNNTSKALSYYQKVRELVPQNEDVRKKIQSLLR